MIFLTNFFFSKRGQNGASEMCENRQGLVLARRAFRSFRFSAQAGSSSAYTRHAGLESALAFIQRERERERGIKRRGASRRESARGQTARELLRETPPLPLPGHPPRAPIQDGESLVCTASPCSARAIHPDLLPTFFFVCDFSVSESACAGIAAADVFLSLHGSDLRG